MAVLQLRFLCVRELGRSGGTKQVKPLIVSVCGPLHDHQREGCGPSA